MIHIQDLTPAPSNALPDLHMVQFWLPEGELYMSSYQGHQPFFVAAGDGDPVSRPSWSNWPPLR